jgi:short-subunit dehydrogenase
LIYDEGKRPTNGSDEIPALGYNAGFGLRAVEETAAEEVERVYRTNIFGLLHAT